MHVGTQLVAGVAYVLVAYEDKTPANEYTFDTLVFRNAVVAFEKQSVESKGRELTVVPTEAESDFTKSISTGKDLRQDHTDVQYEKNWLIFIPDYMKK